MKLLAIDGNSMLNRAFYGIRPLTTKDGVHTNALVGFLNTFLRMLGETNPDEVAVAFDRKEPTFRHNQYAEYKANRKGMPPELAEQLPLIKEILTLMGYAIVEMPGYEADDILGTLAAAAASRGDECVIATGDRDALQLVNDNVTVRLATNREPVWYTPEKVEEAYGMPPKRLIELKGLMGDSSDNIPGVKGIGEKTACGLLEHRETLEELYEHLDDPDIRPRVKSLLEQGKSMAYLSRDLGRICLTAPVATDEKTYTPAPRQSGELALLLRKLEMLAFCKKLNLDEDEAPTAETPAKAEFTPLEVKSNPPVEEVAADLQKLGKMDFLLLEDALFVAVGEYAAAFEAPFDFAAAALFSLNLPKRTESCKAVYEAGYFPEHIVFDVTLAGYLLSPSRKSYTVAELSQIYLPDIATSESPEPAQLISLLPLLLDELTREVEAAGMTKLLTEVELPLARVLSDMESLGFAVDEQGIRDFGEMLKSRIEELRTQLFELAGGEFNPNSPKHLQEILFERLGLPPKKKTKSGYSTNAEVLESLRPYHPIVGVLLEYRKLQKLNSTYVEGLLPQICEDGRIHSYFNQTETRTGRISSAEPNLQNIPVRTELGREMRRFFVAKEGCVLLDADYSQIELRILAAISEDTQMIAAFRDGVDIHAVTASQVFHIPLEEMIPQWRSKAKAINFGIVYGIGAYSLSQDIHVSVKEAAEYIKAYLNTYSGVAAYQKRVVEESAARGYVTTMYGRRRELPELADSNKIRRAAGERLALNTPIQGTAADIIKIAMVRVWERLRKEKMQTRLILQVHDELLLEAPYDEADRAAEILQYEMEHAAQLAVELTTEVTRGKNWYEAKEG